MDYLILPNVDNLINSLTHPDPKYVREFINVIGERHMDRMLHKIIDRLDNSKDAERISVIIALGRLKATNAVPRLLQLLERTYQLETCASIMEALGEIMDVGWWMNKTPFVLSPSCQNTANVPRCQTNDSSRLENVRGFGNGKFAQYRNGIFKYLGDLGYRVTWRLLNAADFGVPQLRPRFILVALKKEYADYFEWPLPDESIVTVSDAINDLMSSWGWKPGIDLLKQMSSIAPTLVGGSKKHGGADGYKCVD